MDCFLEPTKQNVLKEAAKRESAAGILTMIAGLSA
jgi:hypothetical protein